MIIPTLTYVREVREDAGMADTSVTQQEIEERRRRDTETVIQMIEIYCRGQHKTPKGQLCPECDQLARYVRERVRKCPVMETKTFCSSCPVHCYSADMRERIRAVMRYSGPRMVFHDPVRAMQHLSDTRKAKREQAKRAAQG